MPPLAVPREKAVRRCVAGSFSGCHDPRKNFFRAGSTFSGAGASNTVKNLIGGISHGIPSLYLPPPEKRRARRAGGGLSGDGGGGAAYRPFSGLRCFGQCPPSCCLFCTRPFPRIWSKPRLTALKMKMELPLKRFRRKKAGSQRLSRSSRPPLPERAALRSRRTISLRPYQNPPQLRTAILTMQYSLGIPEQRV